MDNTHNNVEFGVLQKTSKQSLISIFFYIGTGGHPPPIPTPARHFVPRSRASPLLTQTRPPPPTHNFLDPPLVQYIVNTFMRGTPVFRAPPISPGETPTFRAPGVSPGENTHIPRTSVSPEVNTHVNHGFGGLPTSRPGLRKLPTRQSMSSLWSPYHSILCTHLVRVSPSGYEVPHS